MREDANAIALRAVRAILEGAGDFERPLEGRLLRARVERLPAPPWPASVEGLDEGRDGPWPAPLRVELDWGTGRTVLLFACERRSQGDKYPGAISLRVSQAATDRELFWRTLRPLLDGARDGERVAVTTSAWMSGAIEGEDPAAYAGLGEDLRRRAAAAGLEMVGPRSALLFHVRVPSGEVDPEPATAFQRVVVLALLKLFYFERRDRRGIEGEPLLAVPFVPASPDGSPSPAAPPDERRQSIWALPGGVRAQVDTLRELLAQLASGPRRLEELLDFLAEQYEVRGGVSGPSYLSVLRTLGLAERRKGVLHLTPRGEELLGRLEGGDTGALFDLFESRVIGMLDLLVLAELQGRIEVETAQRLLARLYGVTWKSHTQVNFRRNWLLSMGLLERRPDGDQLTEAGRETLRRYGERTDALRERVRALLEELAEEEDADEEAREQAPESPNADEGPPSAPLAGELHVELEPADVELGALRLPPGVLEQCCAVLTAGNHLLLVGPPGTGKTALATALAEAAQLAGHHEGLLTATASADWTTFDTIGGYALQRDGSLAFRPGIFLRALEERRWLLVDELNRADVDRAFGELMTVLAGRGVQTPYLDGRGRVVSVGPEDGHSHRVPGDFRLLATMNTWDKTSLFRLSYALQRRFGIVYVGIPSDEDYAKVIEEAAERGLVLPPLEAGLLGPLQRLFSRSEGILAVREVGPAVAVDIARYLRARRAGLDGLAEAIAIHLLPQLEGLDGGAAQQARDACRAATAGCSEEAWGALEARLIELFPDLQEARA